LWTISVQVGGVVQPLIPTNRLVAGAPGSTVRMDSVPVRTRMATAADEWNNCSSSNRAAAADDKDVKPNDDFDGDGLSNLQEFYAGTFPFLTTDLLKINDFVRVSPSRINYVSSPVRTWIIELSRPSHLARFVVSVALRRRRRDAIAFETWSATATIRRSTSIVVGHVVHATGRTVTMNRDLKKSGRLPDLYLGLGALALVVPPVPGGYVDQRCGHTLEAVLVSLDQVSPSSIGRWRAPRHSSLESRAGVAPASRGSVWRRRGARAPAN